MDPNHCSMSKDGWQPLNRWKRVSSQQNELETTEQNADGGPDQTIQGQANTVQDAKRRASARRGSDSVRQSVSGYLDARQSAVSNPTEQLVSQHDAMGLPAGQSVNDDNATRQSAAGQRFGQEHIGAWIDQAVAEKSARELGSRRRTLKESILEVGALEQFALRKDVILGVMGRNAVQHDRILVKDSSNVTNFKTEAKHIETVEQATGNETPQSAQVATGPGAMEFYIEELSAEGKNAVKGDHMIQSTLDSVDMSQLTEEPATISQIGIKQSFMKESITETDVARPTVKEPSTMGQVALRKDAIEQVAMDDVGQAAVLPSLRRSEVVGTLSLPAIHLDTMEPTIIDQTARGHSVIRPFGTESGATRQPSLEKSAVESFSIEPINTEQTTTEDTGQAAAEPLSRLSAIRGTLGLPAIRISKEQNVTGQSIIKPFGLEPDTMEQHADQGAIKSFISEPTSSKQATTENTGQAVGPQTTELPVKVETAVEQSLRQSRTEIEAMGENTIGQDTIRSISKKLEGQAVIETGPRQQSALGYHNSGRFSSEPVGLQPSATRQGTNNQYIQSAVVQKRRSVLTGPLGLPTINNSPTVASSVGPILAGQGSLRRITMESRDIGRFASSVNWTQTDLYTESTLRQDDYSPLHRTFSKKTYLPDWIDLDRRPLPKWYDEAKIGIIIHWGLYSVPSYKSEWFWYLWKKGNKEILEFMSKMYRTSFTYQEFGSQFKAQYFDPDEWATLFAKAGAKYVILTAKHHDGFKLFPAKSSVNWNSYVIGPKRDIVKEISKAVVDKGLKFGIYYSLYEWFNPIYEEDKKTLFKTRDYVNEVVWPDLIQLVNSYKPSILWTDGDWEANEYYWKSQDFISWLYNDSPIRDDVVVNNRWGCKQAVHGDFYNRDERHNQPIDESILTKFHKWETSVTMDKQLCWCHRREMKLNEMMTIKELLLEVVTTVSSGGNILINVGPTEDGLITPVFEERLLQLGEWLKINGEAIYGSSPWVYETDDIDDNIYYTCIKDHYDPYKTAAPPGKATDVSIVYTIFFKWPLNGIIKIRNIIAFMRETPCGVILLGENMYLTADVIHDDVYILLPDKAKVKSKFAWTLKFISKSSLKDDLGSIVIPLKDTPVKRSKSGNKLGSKTGMKSSSKIVTRLSGKLSKLH